MTGRRDQVEVRAYAKINYSLDVLRKRPDGFHELRSVMQTISLHDTITFSLGHRANQREVDVDLSLINRAISAVLEATQSCAHVSFTIRKRIPVAAGFGGGSSDCAFALLATNKLIGAPLAHTDLLQLACRLGSDVPFFLTCGTALVEGRGERVQPLPDGPPRWFVLVNGGAMVSTATVFESVLPEDYGTGSATDRCLKDLDIGAVSFGGNDLTPGAVRAYPEVADLIDSVAQLAPPGRVALSGSGGTVLAMFDTPDAAIRARDQLHPRFPFCEVASTILRSVALGRFALGS